MMPDPIDRMIEILGGFELAADDMGLDVQHKPCRTTVATTWGLRHGEDIPEIESDLGAAVKAAIMHAGECPGPPPPAEQPERKPCGDVHTGPCEVVDREETPDGVWLNVRHLGGEGRVFLGEL
jgi:hypothetical protein